MLEESGMTQVSRTVPQRTEGDGKQPEHTHRARIHTHDHDRNDLPIPIGEHGIA
jgi:hypothetical protein